MPSLRETLRGHVRGGHDVTLLLPKYQLFEDRPKPVAVNEDEGYEIHVVPCRWVPALMFFRRLARRVSRGKEILFPLRLCLNLCSLMLITMSFTLASLRAGRRTKKRFDLVYAHNQYMALAGRLVARWWRVPNVTRLYGTFLADLMKKPLVSLRYPAAAAGYFVPCSMLICGNDGTRGDEVAKEFKIDPARFRFWQNGVDLPDEPVTATRETLFEKYASLGLRSESLWAVSCSRLSYWKRIDRMIRAISSARRAGSDWQLLVAGSGSEEERLRSLAKELGVEDAIVWLGAVEHDAIWGLMHNADAFMLTNDVTNRCNPLYEAISALLPVVSVKDPSTQDLLEHEANALLAEKDDTDLLGAHLQRLAANVELAERLQEGQKAVRSQMWSWRERMDAELAELEKLCQGHPSAPEAVSEKESSCR